MKWTELTNREQLAVAIEESKSNPVIIFKHSIRCSISGASLSRLERTWKEEELPQVKAYFLDLISYRDISNEIEKILSVEHQSPQLILIRDGKALYDKSHFDIDFIGIKNAVIAAEFARS